MRASPAIPFAKLSVVSELPAPSNGFAANPVPWRIVKAHSEVSAILDANGRTVFIARHDVAVRIVAAVNAAESRPRPPGERG